MKTKIVLSFLLVYIFESCDSDSTIYPRVIPPIFVQNTEGVSQKGNQIFKKEKPFSGYLFTLFPNGDTASVTSYFEGLREGWAIKFYANKQKQEARFYVQGKREGRHQSWWENGNLKFEYHFKNDLHEGAAKEWAINGSQTMDFNFKKGYEDGLQKGWFSDGSLQFNYVVRNGRQYGMTGVKNCQSVWDETTKAFVKKRFLLARE